MPRLLSQTCAVGGTPHQPCRPGSYRFPCQPWLIVTRPVVKSASLRGPARPPRPLGRAELVAQWRLVTEARRVVDEYGVLLTSLLARDGLGAADFIGVSLSTTV